MDSPTFDFFKRMIFVKDFLKVEIDLYNRNIIFCRFLWMHKDMTGLNGLDSYILLRVVIFINCLSRAYQRGGYAPPGRRRGASAPSPPQLRLWMEGRFYLSSFSLDIVQKQYKWCWWKLNNKSTSGKKTTNKVDSLFYFSFSACNAIHILILIKILSIILTPFVRVTYGIGKLHKSYN